MDSASNDDLCRRCGRCCYAKVIIDDVYSTDVPCQYLDTASNNCTVYERRFELNPECLTVPQGIRARVFPADCPYVADVKGYRPPRDDRDPSEMGRISVRDT